MVFCVDKYGQTLLHKSARYGTVDMVKDIIAALPRHTAMKLAAINNNDNRTAAEISKTEAIRASIAQAFSNPVEYYHFQTLPEVLIFYSTRNRQAPEVADGEIADAEAEKDCVERYFKDRNYPCQVKQDPTAAEIFSAITGVQSDESVSGLLVFVMGHGQNGMVSVERTQGKPDSPNFLLINELITHMCRGIDGRPKVLVLQACQESNQSAEIFHSAGNVIAPSSSRSDPRPVVTALQRAKNEGICLKYHPDFLLYQATVSGGSALRHVMIPCLIESLNEMEETTSDNLLLACIHANNKVKQELKRLDPSSFCSQLPKIETTLTKNISLRTNYQQQQEKEKASCRIM